MKLIILTGEAKVGKTNALKLLEKVNDGTIILFYDEVGLDDIIDLNHAVKFTRDEDLVVVTTNDQRVKEEVDIENVFIFSQDLEQQKKFLVSNKSRKLDWTEAFYWLKSNAKEQPANVEEFFNFICK